MNLFDLKTRMQNLTSLDFRSVKQDSYMKLLRLCLVYRMCYPNCDYLVTMFLEEDYKFFLIFFSEQNKEVKPEKE